MQDRKPGAAAITENLRNQATAPHALSTLSTPNSSIDTVLADVCVPANEISGSTAVHPSPSGHFTLVTERYRGDSTERDFASGAIFSRDGFLITRVLRNHPQFPFAFVEKHPDGGNYLVCSSNHQGMTVVNLGTGAVVNFIAENPTEGGRFCPLVFEPSADGTRLLVTGCFLGSPSETKIFDFSIPMARLPLTTAAD